MKNFIKMITCLYASVITASSMEDKAPVSEPKIIQFTGDEYVADRDYIKFEVDEDLQRVGFWQIKKVSINEALLKKEKEPKEIIIKIRGFQGNRDVTIEPKAFKDLKSKYLKIKLQFEENTSCKDDRKRVLFPEDCDQMFGDSASITESDFSGANLNSITNTKGMFVFCRNLTKINFGDSTTPNLTDMSCMFQGCESLAKLDLRNFDTRKVTNMYRTFYNCATLKELDLSNFNTSNVSNMMYMFYNCENLKELDLKKFDTSKVAYMQLMFSGCKNLENLKLNNFYIRKAAMKHDMFYNCSKLSRVCVPETQIDLFKNLILPKAKNAVVYFDVNIDDFEVINKPKKDNNEIKDDLLNDEDDF